MDPSPTSAMMGLGIIFNVDEPGVGWSLRVRGGMMEDVFLSVSCLEIERLSVLLNNFQQLPKES